MNKRKTALSIISLLLIAAISFIAFREGCFEKKNGPASGPKNKADVESNIMKNEEMELAKHYKTDVVFLGDSLTAMCDWGELFSESGLTIENRGISGNKTTDVLERLNAVIDLKPRKIFLMIGINDLWHGRNEDAVIESLMSIFDRFDEHKEVQIFIQSVLPTGLHDLNQGVAALNGFLYEESGRRAYTYIDLYGDFVHGGVIKAGLDVDGVHLSGEGYRVWKEKVHSFVAG